MHLGIIGFGNFATALIDLLAAAPIARVTVTVRPGSKGLARHRADQKPAGMKVDVVSSFNDLLEAAPGLVADTAGQAAVASFSSTLLECGTDKMILSVGALAGE